MSTVLDIAEIQALQRPTHSLQLGSLVPSAERRHGAPVEDNARSKHVIAQLLSAMSIGDKVRNCLVFRSTDTPSHVRKFVQECIEATEIDKCFYQTILANTRIAGIAQALRTHSGNDLMYADCSLEILDSFNHDDEIKLGDQMHKVDDLKAKIRGYKLQLEKDERYCSPIFTIVVRQIIAKVIRNELLPSEATPL